MTASSVEEWLELESDPGLFTMLLENIGVKGVQVEDVYDLTEEIFEDVFGFVFLFKWHDESKKNKRPQPNTPNSAVNCNKSNFVINNDSKSVTYETNPDKLSQIYFAHQIIPNSCATNALLSVLMNCSERINLGSILSKFRDTTINMSPEKRGFALGSMPELADAHNKRARYLRAELENNYHNITTSVTTPPSRKMFNESDSDANKTYHFVSYVQIGDGLYELDGLQPNPIKHGTITANNWTKPCLNIIRNRMQQKSEHFSLMAVVRDRRQVIADQLAVLNKNKSIIQQALFQMDQGSENQIKKDIADPSDNKCGDTLRNICDPKITEVHGSYPGSCAQANNGKRRTSDRVTLRNQRKMEVMKKSLEHNFSTEGCRSSESASLIIKSEEKISETVCPLDILRPISVDMASINSLPSDQVSSDNLTTSSSSGKGPKYPTRSSTRRDTIASNSLAQSRSTMSSNAWQQSELPTFSTDQLKHLLHVVDVTIASCKSRMSDEIEKRNKYVTDDIRRSYNYDDFIHAFLFALKKQGLLQELLEQQAASKKATKRAYRASSTCTRMKLMASQESALSSKAISVHGRAKRRK